MTPTTTRTIDEARVLLLERLERKVEQLGQTVDRMQRMKKVLMPLITRLRLGEAAQVVEAELSARAIDTA